MARTATIRNKIPAKASTKGTSRPSKSTSFSGSRISKSSSKSKPIHPKSNKQLKTKSTQAAPKKKTRTYTAEELGVPALNGIVPAGVTKPKGQKKGKVFVDDEEQMMTILKIVEAEAEGHIEGKMVRQRKLEEVREARRAEAEKKEARRKGKLEDVKDEIRTRKKAKGKGKTSEGGGATASKQEQLKAAITAGVPKKRVSFA